MWFICVEWILNLFDHRVEWVCCICKNYQFIWDLWPHEELSRKWKSFKKKRTFSFKLLFFSLFEICNVWCWCWMIFFRYNLVTDNICFVCYTLIMMCKWFKFVIVFMIYDNLLASSAGFIQQRLGKQSKIMCLNLIVNPSHSLWQKCAFTISFFMSID